MARLRKMSLPPLTVATTTLLLITTPGVATPVSSDSSDALSPETEVIMRKQEALSPAASIIMDAVDRDANSGFGNISYSDDSTRLILYWKGELSPGVAEAVATARKIGTIEIAPAAYSLAELRSEASKLETADGLAGTNIQEISYQPDNSGLIIEKMPPATAARIAAKSGAVLAVAEHIIASKQLRVPVQIRTAAAPYSLLLCTPSTPTNCNRQDDTAPWNSGAYMSLTSDFGHPTTVLQCTSGFGVLWQGQSYVLTAAHCATWYAGGGDYAYDFQGEYIGRAMPQEDWDHDVIMLDARGQFWMWDGTLTTSIKKTVHSWGPRVNGEFLCQSGSRSGTVCDLQTQNNTFSNFGCDSDGDCFTMHDLGKVIQTHGLVAGRPGDSGGPVFALDGNGVRAKGLVSAGSGSTMLFVTMNSITTGRGGSSPWPSGVVPRTA